MKDEPKDDLILFLAVIAQSFTDSKHEPISLSLADFEPLSFQKVNEFVDHFAGSKTFIVLSHPKTAKDDTPYKLEQTEYQKAEFAKTKAEMEHLRDMQMLMIYFGRVCLIYDTVSGGYVGFDDGQINRMYLLLTIRLDKLLAKEEFAELREAKPELYDTLLGSFEDLDMAYEFMRPEIWGYYGKLERLWLEKADGLGSFELKEDEQKLLDDTDKAIEEHKQDKTRMNQNFEKHLETISAKAKAEEVKSDKPADDEGGPIEYDDEHGKATYRDKSTKLFDTDTIMSVLTHRVFQADGARIRATDIIFDIEAKRIAPDKELSTKTLTNAKDRINEKFYKAFRIKDVICYERQQFWLNLNCTSLASPYRIPSNGN